MFLELNLGYNTVVLLNNSLKGLVYRSVYGELAFNGPIKALYTLSRIDATITVPASIVYNKQLLLRLTSRIIVYKLLTLYIGLLG